MGPAPTYLTTLMKHFFRDKGYFYVFFFFKKWTDVQILKSNISYALLLGISTKKIFLRHNNNIFDESSIFRD
jgi:hypothetical protein